MNTAELLVEAYGRIAQEVPAVLDGLDGADDPVLTFRVDPEANTVAWLVWHLSRVQDDHLAGVSDAEQVWTAQGFAERFALPFADDAIGYGQSPQEAGQVRVAAADLLAYHRAVHERSVEYLGGITDDELDRVVDRDWDPPVTLAVRLVSVLSDALQHVGQAAYVRGVAERSLAAGRQTPPR